jgi:hypothetical protein
MAECRFCKTTIIDGATVCPQCKLYQRPNLNILPYLGGLVALLAIVGSSGAYIMSSWQNLQAISYGSPKLIVLAAASKGGAALHNSGSRDIFVSGIVFDSALWRDSLPINRVLHPGELVHVEYKEPAYEQRQSRCLSFGEVGWYLKDIKEGSAEVRNQEFHFYTVDHPGLRAHFNLDGTHAVINGTGKVLYIPVGSDKYVEQDISCKVLIMQRADAQGEFPDQIRVKDGQIRRLSDGGPIPLQISWR